LLGLSIVFVRLLAFPSAAAALPPEAIDDVAPLSVLHVPPVPSVLADVPPAAALPAEPTVPAALQSWADTGCPGRTAKQMAPANVILFNMVLFPYLAGFVMLQVPSDRRVMTEPSGRVAVAMEKDWLPALPELTDDPAADDAELPPELDVVVRPSRVVDEDTLPPPAVTEVDVPSPVEDVPSITVQAVPSSSFTCSSANAAAATMTIRITGSARALLVTIGWDFMMDSSHG
jgi:hypothetical protein